MAQFRNIFPVDLQTGYKDPVPLMQPVGEGDAKGVRVGARVTNNGADVDLGGQCVGYVRRPDGSTVPLTGTISGNQAYVTLDQTCCAIEGPIQVAVAWVSGTNITTLVVAYGTVVNTITGNTVQPSTPIPDLTQLLAQIDAMEQATARANAAADKAVRYDQAQSLTNEQMATARNNIGAASADVVNELNVVTSDNVDAIRAISTPITSDVTTVRTDSTFINTQGVVAATGTSYYTLSADVTAGIKYIVNGFAAQNCYLYIFVDSGGNTIYKSKEKGATGGTNYSEVVATAPANAAKLIVDGNVAGSRTQAFIGKLDGYYATDNGFIPTAEIGIIPSSLFPHYPFIDSINSRVTVYNSTIIIDRRTKNKRYYTVAEDLTVDYSGISSSAIAIYFDVANSSFIAVQYGNAPDASKYLLFMLIRTNVVSANHITVSAAFPVIIDGMIDGVIYSKNKNIRSINHRGLEQVAPENTLIAFKYSQMAGFDGVETDVRFTSDNVPVLLHDATINRTARNADGTEISGDIAIADITYQEALTYDFGVFKNSRFAGTKIPTFEQFIKACRNLGLHPYIELKVGTEQQIQNLNTIVIRNGMQGKVTWISYSLAFLGYIHSVDAKARLGVVSSIISSSTDFINQILALKSENEVFYDLDNVNAITDEGVERLIALGLPLELYTGTIANVVNADPYVSGFTLGAFNGGKELIAHWE